MKKKEKEKIIIEEDLESEMNESILKGTEIENLIKRRITQSSKIHNKRFSCTLNDNRKHKKSSKTFLSGEYQINESDEDIILNKNNISDQLNGNLRLHENENENLFEKLNSNSHENKIIGEENKLVEEKEYNRNTICDMNENAIEGRDSNVFNSVENDQKNRSNSKYDKE